MQRSWYQEIEQKLDMAIARMDARKRRAEREGSGIHLWDERLDVGWKSQVLQEAQNDELRQEVSA